MGDDNIGLSHITFFYAIFMYFYVRYERTEETYIIKFELIKSSCDAISSEKMTGVMYEYCTVYLVWYV